MIALVQKRSYPSVGQCIYCGSTQKPLGNEHIIAFSLGGQLVLKDASCRKCENTTGRIEGVCARQMLGNFRIRMDMPTKRPKNRPIELPIEVIREDNTTEIIKIPVQDYPRILTLPKFSPPEALTGEPRSIEPQLWISANKKDIAKLGESQSVRQFGTTHKLNIPVFFQMLAKIAHAYAVAEMGLERLSSLNLLLPNFIRHGSKNLTSLIGGNME